MCMAEAAGHRLRQMAASFPDARVTGYESLIGSIANHPKDRHVLAAAVVGRADVLVTENLRDFPAAAVAPYDIMIASQDQFLPALLESFRVAVDQFRLSRRELERDRRDLCGA